MAVVLGIDTSCYTTSAAAVNEAGQVVVSSRKLLPVKGGERGLRQSEAVFAHVRQLSEVVGEALKTLRTEGKKIVAICASDKPRDVDESYMPVFNVGLNTASVLSEALDVPLYTASHQQGHIAAGTIGNPQLSERFIALHISGGTTELLLNECGKLTLLGGSNDLHAGQLIDRVGVHMGFGFPAGPKLEQLAMQGKAKAAFPVSMEKEGLHCHLSGAEAQAMRLIDAGGTSNEDIAAEVFDLLTRTIARLITAASETTGAKEVLIVGGVASSILLRQALTCRLERSHAKIKPIFGKSEYSADNACGTALLGMQSYLYERR